MAVLATRRSGGDDNAAVDREAIARARRRVQVEEHLADEREREVALRETLEERIVEADGPALDEGVFASLSPEEAQLVRNALTGVVLVAEPPPEGSESFWGDAEEPLEDQSADPDSLRAELEEEIARLQGELEACRARQQAYERYLQALDA